MARIDLNSAVGALRGKMDGWVYRQLNGQTVVAAHRRAKKTKPTAGQVNRRERFRAAQAYAAEVLADPVKRLVYQKLGAERKTPPNALLISNFLTPPMIDTIDFRGYTGRSGQQIKVIATDAIEVTAVMLCIRNATGTEIESGPATKDHGVWSYRTTTSLPANATWKIEATARNRAGTEATRSA
jgi:hypothetical protein